MGTEALKTMQKQLMSCVQGQFGDLSKVDTHELGEAVDMIKDLAESIYYCTITEAMEKSEEKNGERVQTVNYYTSPIYAKSTPNMMESDYRMMERNGGYMYYPSGSGGGSGGQGQGTGATNYMYYPTGPNGDTTNGGNMDSVGMLGNGGRVVNYYTNPDMMRDPRQGRSPMRRRMYMEGKEAHNDTNSQLRELEAYLQELSKDITEMIKDASPEERATLHQKMSTLADKIV